MAVATQACSSATAIQSAQTLPEFETRLEALRSQYHVPGMSAVVDGPQGTVWQHAYGMADIEKQTPVTAATLFHLASLTKPFAAVIALQLEHEKLLSLDDYAATYGINVGDPVRLRHLLSHTSESTPPGTAYRYSGNRYGMIETAMTKVTGKSFAQLYDERIRKPLGLEMTVPNPRDAASFKTLGISAATYAALLARGYAYDAKAGFKQVTYESYFGPAAGMIATPSDIVRFSRALDDDQLLDAAARNAMWTPATAAGRTMPYGTGWFVQNYHGEKVVWHYGLWTGASALIIKIPARHLTFAALANSPMLSMPFPLGEGDITTSPFAMLFLRSFVDASPGS
jgi:CubicO group peptidase (beta-lactamase class C family)